MRASGAGRAVLVGMASMFLVSTAVAQAQTDTPTPSDKRQAVADLISRARVDGGLPPMARSTELDAAAQGHSDDMVGHNYLDHTGSDGSEPQDRADATGYHVPPGTGWIVVEVISAISGDPSGPVNWWMGEPQHRRVLLNSRWREMGVGYAQGGQYGNYWTVDVGCRPSVLPIIQFDGQTYTRSEDCD